MSSAARRRHTHTGPTREDLIARLSQRVSLDDLCDLVEDLSGQAPIAAELARRERVRLGLEQACVVCGCSTTRACPGGCVWVKTNLCSRCAKGAREAVYGG